MDKPVYNFLGFVTSSIHYVKTRENNTYISINLTNSNFDSNTKQYTISVRVAADFDDDESYFIFEAGFEINNLDWFNKLNEAQRKTTFFASLFPFIREKIFSITSDSNVGLFIPTISVENINFDKEIRLIRVKKSQQ